MGGRARLAPSAACALGTALAVSATMVAATASGARPSTAPVAHEVAIEAFEFHPPALAVHVGDTIVWRNTDIVAHTITSDAPSWDSDDVAPRTEFRLVPARKN